MQSVTRFAGKFVKIVQLRFKVQQSLSRVYACWTGVDTCSTRLFALRSQGYALRSGVCTPLTGAYTLLTDGCKLITVPDALISGSCAVRSHPDMVLKASGQADKSWLHAAERLLHHVQDYWRVVERQLQYDNSLWHRDRS
jgi:hypothetical protein